MITTRRQLLINGVRVAAVAPFLSLVHGATPRRAGGRALVVIQLTGGNDGLNTVVPYRQDAYYRSRPSLSLARDALHTLDDEHGFHPRMGGLAKLYSDGDLAVVHGVGYPNPDRSHFRSMEIWHTGDPEPAPGDTGWLGRLADQLAQRQPGSMAALHVGAEDLPQALTGREYFSPTVRNAAGFRLREVASGFADARSRLLDSSSGSDDLGFLREAAKSTYVAADRMSSLAARDTKVTYPGTELARRLRLVARLIAGDFGTRVFHVSLGGFDTHAKQRKPHADLLGTLSEAVSAFQEDLTEAGAADNVATLVFSEFGRRVRENASGGTDHGAAAPVLVVGRTVNGGIYGEAPNLARLEEGDVPPTTDLRSIYRTLEESWMKLRPTSEAHRVLPLVQ